MKLKMAEIHADPSVSIRQHLNQSLIDEYMEIFDRLPPVDVFGTEEGNLLADGFHRYAAAQQLNRTEMEVNLHKGTREDALEFAAVANLCHGLRITADEKRLAIQRLHRFHPAWKFAELAKKMGLSVMAVEICITAARFKADVPEAEPLPDSSAHILGTQAPTNHRTALAMAAVEQGWSKEELQAVIRNVKDPEVSDDRKAAILRGDSPPIVMKNGVPAVLADTVGRRLAEAKRNDAKLRVWDLLTRLARLRSLPPAALAQKFSVKDLDHLRRELPGDIAWLQQLLDAAKESMERPKVVKIR